MRWQSSGFAMLLALFCADQVHAQDRIVGIKKPVLSCAPAYGVLPSPLKSPTIPVEHLKNLKISAWSMNDFRIRNSGNYERRTDWQDERRPRSYQRAAFLSEEQLQNIKRTITSRSPDILLMTEIIDLASLRMFASHARYLNGAYDVYVHPVNQFGSNIAFLVKKGLPLKFEFESHVHAHRIDKYGQSRRIFTRDVPALLIRPLDDNDSDKVVVLLGVHAKSERKVETDNSMNSDEIWFHEMIGIEQIRSTYRGKFPKANIGIIGDINADVQNSTAVQILKVEMESFLDLQGLPAGHPGRATHFTFANNRILATQRDDMLMDGGLFTHYVGGQVVPFMDALGNPKLDPRNWQERDGNSTDHKMIEATFDFFSLFFGKPH